VLVSAFETPEDCRRWQESELLAAHRERIRPLMERVEPGMFEPVYAAGTV
jgi:hypothetical protein